MNFPFYLLHNMQSDKFLNSLNHSISFIFPQLSCKIIAAVIKHPYNTVYFQSVSQLFILQVPCSVNQALSCPMLA